MSANLGNVTDRLRLLCHECGWLPPDDLEMALVEAHYGMEHPQAEKITLDLLPVCPCGTAMKFLHWRPNGPGSSKDYFDCPVDGNTGFVKRDDEPKPEEAPPDGQDA